MEDVLMYGVLLYLLPPLLAAVISASPGTLAPCARPSLGATPSRVDKTPGDNGFRIRVIGRPQPEGYIAGNVYTVAVESTFPGHGMRGFQLVSVPQYATDETTQLGHFQHLDPRTSRFSTNCPHVVMHTGSWVRGRADVLWTAPPSGAGCIEFRATIFYGESGKWLQDDGALTKQFCELDRSEQSPRHAVTSGLTQAPVDADATSIVL